MMGSADYLRVGDWNFRCDRCGKKLKGSEGKQTWQGYWVCPEHWEPRQPQDFVRSIQEHPTPPFVRNPSDTFIDVEEWIALETSLWDDSDYIASELGITVPFFLISE